MICTFSYFVIRITYFGQQLFGRYDGLYIFFIFKIPKKGVYIPRATKRNVNCIDNELNLWLKTRNIGILL